MTSHYILAEQAWCISAAQPRNAPLSHSSLDSHLRHEYRYFRRYLHPVERDEWVMLHDARAEMRIKRAQGHAYANALLRTSESQWSARSKQGDVMIRRRNMVSDIDITLHSR